MESVTDLLYLSSLSIPILLLVISWRFQISHKPSLVAGICFVLLVPVAVLMNLNDVANLIAILAYYMLSVGVILSIIEYRRKKDSSNEDERSYASPMKTFSAPQRDEALSTGLGTSPQS